jgi:hypothetical protein
VATGPSADDRRVRGRSKASRGDRTARTSSAAISALALRWRWDEGAGECAAATAAADTNLAFVKIDRESMGRTNRPGTRSDTGRLNPVRPRSHSRRGAGLVASEGDAGCLLDVIRQSRPAPAHSRKLASFKSIAYLSAQYSQERDMRWCDLPHA